MNILSQFGLSFTNQISVGNWYQNLFFYTLIGVLICLNYYYIKQKNKIRPPASAVPLEDKALFQLLSLSGNAVAIYSNGELVIEYANEAMLGYWRKDHNIIGKTAKEALSEQKNQAHLDLLGTVWETGITLVNTDVAGIVVVKGVPQTLYLDSEYKAIKDDAGKMLHILQTTTEVTASYLNRKALMDDNRRLAADVVKLKDELMSTGQELELSYDNADRLSTRLLAALDCFSAKIELPDTGFWSLDLQTLELTFSDNGRAIHGLPPGIKLTYADGLKMIDPDYYMDIAAAMENSIKSGVGYIKEYKIRPWDGSDPKRLKVSGNVVYNQGIAAALTGNFVIITYEI